MSPTGDAGMTEFTRDVQRAGGAEIEVIISNLRERKCIRNNPTSSLPLYQSEVHHLSCRSDRDEVATRLQKNCGTQADNNINLGDYIQTLSGHTNENNIIIAVLHYCHHYNLGELAQNWKLQVIWE